MDIKKFMLDENEKPLDRLPEDGGFCSIFRTIACVGDSLSSGEFQSLDADSGEYRYHDMYEYSWGQYIARMTGAKVYNFSRGGMTAKEYCESFAEANGFWDEDKKAQCYKSNIFLPSYYLFRFFYLKLFLVLPFISSFF